MPHGLDTDKQVFFYEQEFYCLSSFSAFPVTYCGRIFNTAEHAYHAEKFDILHMKDWLSTQYMSAHDAFRYAQAHKQIYRPDWYDIRVARMRDVQWHKFLQHMYVRKKLRETLGRELIENSWRDDFWGSGPNGDGKNMLGKNWMEIREYAEQQNLWEVPL